MMILGQWFGTFLRICISNMLMTEDHATGLRTMFK